MGARLLSGSRSLGRCFLGKTRRVRTMNEIERIEHNGHIIRIMPDDDPMNPREWDNLGTILYSSSRYVLGDKEVSVDEIEEITQRDDVIWLPVYAYIHSGVVLNTGGFSCPWDSGMSGIIYVEKKAAEAAWAGFEDDYSEDRVRKVLQGEVETFSQYVSGDIYGYVVETATGEHVNSCWGFFGHEGVKEAISDARGAADWEVTQAEQIANQNG